MGVTWSFVNFTGHWTHVCTSRHSAATGWSRAALWTLPGTGHTSARLGTHERTVFDVVVLILVICECWLANILGYLRVASVPLGVNASDYVIRFVLCCQCSLVNRYTLSWLMVVE